MEIAMSLSLLAMTVSFDRLRMNGIVGEILRCAQNDKGGAQNDKGGAQNGKGELRMT